MITHFGETLNGISTIRAFSIENNRWLDVRYMNIIFYSIEINITQSKRI